MDAQKRRDILPAGQREWTMERITEALDVAIKTVSLDPGNFVIKTKLKHSKTTSNPKVPVDPKALPGAAVHGLNYGDTKRSRLSEGDEYDAARTDLNLPSIEGRLSVENASDL